MVTQAVTVTTLETAFYDAGILKGSCSRAELFIKSIYATRPRRIEASQKTHEELERKIEEIKKALIGLQNQVRESNEKKELLIAKLNDLTLQLQSLTDEPRWMGRGALEKLRKEGREFGSACSRR